MFNVGDRIEMLKNCYDNIFYGNRGTITSKCNTSINNMFLVNITCDGGACGCFLVSNEDYKSYFKIIKETQLNVGDTFYVKHYTLKFKDYYMFTILDINSYGKSFTLISNQRIKSLESLESLVYTQDIYDAIDAGTLILIPKDCKLKDDLIPMGTTEIKDNSIYYRLKVGDIIKENDFCLYNNKPVYVNSEIGRTYIKVYLPFFRKFDINN
jgi:hypothetical protein